jgi:hypothetical protein
VFRIGDQQACALPICRPGQARSNPSGGLDQSKGFARLTLPPENLAPLKSTKLVRALATTPRNWRIWSEIF